MKSAAKLPSFSLSDYRAALRRLKSAGYRLLPVTAMAHDPSGKAVYLRHDVDFSPILARQMAAVEKDEGCAATYYFLLTGQYNLFGTDDHKALTGIKELGHEIGLHYDLLCYPREANKALRHLRFEISVLSELSGGPVRSICMHQPSLGGKDIFKDKDGFVHPHNSRYQKDLVYISDSCRAWRDDRLLDFYQTNGPRRLLLNVHPELWIKGSVKTRLDYLNVLHRIQVQTVDDFYFKYAKKIWAAHAGGKIHDARMNPLRRGRKT